MERHGIDLCDVVFVGAKVCEIFLESRTPVRSQLNRCSLYFAALMSVAIEAEQDIVPKVSRVMRNCVCACLFPSD